MEDTFSTGLNAALKLAKNMAIAEHHTSFGVAHLALAMLYEPSGLREVLEGLGKDIAYMIEWFEMRKESYQSEEIPFDDSFEDREIKKLWEEAVRSKIKLGADTIDAVCVFMAIVREGVIYSAAQIELLGVEEKEFLNQFSISSFELSASDSQAIEEMTSGFAFAVNLKTDKIITEGSLVIGREEEVRNILENLERTQNKATLLVGDSGIGKTAIVKAFVKELNENRDHQLQNTLVFGLNVSKLLSGSTSENELSKKTVELFEKLNKLQNTSILVIDDLQVLLENATGKSNLMINVLNSQLSEGATNLIMCISSDAYHKYLEKHPIHTKLEVLQLEELDHFHLLKCLERHQEHFQKAYQIEISQATLAEAIYLSRRYFKESKLPYGAIDLIDRTLAAVKMSNANTSTTITVFKKKLEKLKTSEEKDFSKLQLWQNTLLSKLSAIISSRLIGSYVLTEETPYEEGIAKMEALLVELEALSAHKITCIEPTEIEAIIAVITGIPIGKIQADEKDRLLNIENRLQERVKGQNRAIQTLADAIIESRSGLSNPKQPIGSFFFLGPTGTGKTELTKSLAELLFDDENAMIRFDMSEFKEEHSAALLYGAPPGYVGYEEGGMLVTKIRQKPYSVVLFDEIEKAHSSVYDVFLQIMDEGTIHDKLGRSGDFSNAIIIFTSNIASSWIAEEISKGHTPTSNELIEVMSEYFRPEFLGRLTEVVPFSPITEAVAQDIFLLHLSKLQQQLQVQKNISLSLTEEALHYLSNKGYSQKYGARPIAGIIRNYLKKAISKFIVAQQVKEGETLKVDYKDNQLIWSVE
ncbi:AAA family ATPase [Capnocytophaga sp. oral taxon 878]|uniref:AAA family ATPase n=1 Tax=Capnocytophaga sp. oral taxon 878 TaxID=1316596 RepID=UPI000D040EFE|nr:ATP-dependent Clp protease ATP-binding subunit [Capnocytophaga sp. oral taxon 878]AVM50204.1 ATP-dependent Clp protease ATP-binding subunit [Capnocytophaga sp. oral taxon 878]